MCWSGRLTSFSQLVERVLRVAGRPPCDGVPEVGVVRGVRGGRRRGRERHAGRAQLQTAASG